MRGNQLEKYPPGYSTGTRVLANAQHDAAYPQSPRGRQGIVMAPTRRLTEVHVLWDGCRSRRPFDLRFLTVIGQPKSAKRVRRSAKTEERASL